MLNILLFIIIPILIGLLFSFFWHREWQKLDFITDILVAFMVVVVSFLAMLLLVTAITTPAEQEYIHIETIPIYAIENNNSIHGSFFLGSGSVSGKAKYYYISDYKEGKKIYSIDLNKAYVVESNDKIPCIEVYKSQFTNEWLRKHFINVHEENAYKIIIPVGSIKYNFNVDLR